MDTYSWFFYIGISLLISHLLTEGISLDIPFFGLLLIVIGWRKMVLWQWITICIWILIVIEILATIFKLQQRIGKYLDPSGHLMKADITMMSDNNDYDDYDDYEDDEDFYRI